jgi:hypothetical protein
MTQLRAPRVVGVSGGVGTTTLATAVRGHDRGRTLDQGVDILVCRSTGESLHAAASMINWLVSVGQPRPVLAVTSDGPIPLRGPLRARMRMMEPQVAGLVVLPYVSHWRELTDPLSQVARLSECPAEQLPKTLRGYGEAIGELAEVVLRAGLLVPARGARVVPPGGYPAGGHGGSQVRPAHQTGPHQTGPQPPAHQTGPRLPYQGTPHTGPQTVTSGGVGAETPVVGGINNFEMSIAPAVLYGGAK